MIQSTKPDLLSDRERHQAVHFLNAIEALCVNFYVYDGIKPSHRHPCREIELIMATASLGVSTLAGPRNKSNAPLGEDKLNDWVSFLDHKMEGKASLADICTKLGI